MVSKTEQKSKPMRNSVKKWKKHKKNKKYCKEVKKTSSKCDLEK